MVMRAETWLLPDGVEDVLPASAARLEMLRRRLLDMFAVNGYELVFPPLVEYIDSLLTGSGRDLDVMTFKVTDQMTGRLMGIRADITPQVARLDAHCLPRNHTARYCYSGVVLNTQPQGLSTCRAPIQIGAELYGYAGVAADIEIIRLMLTTLTTAGASDIHLDLGHVAVFRELAQAANLSAAVETQLFDIYQRKSLPELNALLPSLAHSAWFAALGELSGDVSILAKAQPLFADAPEAVQHALNDLQQVAHALQCSHPQVKLSVDLSELRGYHYHTGLVFAAYTPRSAAEIAKGGRYDHIGEAFGRARPATGFSANLRSLVDFFVEHGANEKIFAPLSEDATLMQAIAQLRAQGRIVIQALAGDYSSAADFGCQQQLVYRDKVWLLTSL